MYRSFFLVHALLKGGRIVVVACSGLATFLIFANVLYARPDINVAAFMTYLCGFVGRIVLLLQRDFIVSQIERHRHFSPAAPMGATRMTLVSFSPRSCSRRRSSS